MVSAVEKVRDRLYRSTGILEKAGIPYAVIGGNAIAAWVARIDPVAVRNTQDVDILIRREDLPAAKVAFEEQGFIYRHSSSIDMFLDGPGTKARDVVHILMAREKVHPTDFAPTADVTEFEASQDGGYRHLKLDALVRMKLTSYRDKDRMHLRDLIDVGLLDATWPAKFPPELGARLQAILDDPDG
ncbi:MAG TPA: hypothetical protein VGJ05_20500 [Fimbriiglobus sp.]|jgi:hypothetical protein